MAKSINLTVNEWTVLRKQLRDEYDWKPSVFMIREVMRRELGFTIRFHQEWIEHVGMKETVALDFYDDNLETLFRLKYL